ncbi:MAG: hypothetical protein ACRDOG_15900 [Gaiellaceae bacterium]|jgi:hypothetical protein
MSLKKRRVGIAVGLVAAALVLLTAAGALAMGPPVVNDTVHVVNEISTDIDVHPCTGQPAELTFTESGVIHFAAFADGTVHFTGTLRGTFSADALPTDGIPDATGTTVVWFGGNGALLEDGSAFGKAQTAFTLNGKGTNADGTTFGFHQNGNVVFDPSGTPKLEFFKERTRCR